VRQHGIPALRHGGEAHESQRGDQDQREHELLAKNEHEKDGQPRPPGPRLEPPRESAVQPLVYLAPQGDDVFISRIKLRNIKLAPEPRELHRRRQPREW
jgi:hypothetical protein